MRRFLVLCTILLTPFAIAACGGSSGSGGSAGSGASSPSGAQSAAGAPVHGGSVAVGIDSDPAPLDPINQTTLGQYQVEAQIYDSLLQASADGAVHPGLVTSWKRTNPTTYVLTLRKGVKFTDGTPFNAAAVVFNINRIRAKSSSWFALTQPITSVDAPNSDTVVIHLKSPYSPLIPLMATRVFLMVSPTAVRKEGSSYGRHPVGTGPFELSKWVPNSSVTLTRNPNYWQSGLPYLNQVRYAIIPDSTTRAVALVSGQIQTIDYLTGPDVSRVQGQPNLVYRTWPGVLVMYVALNPAHAPLNNPKVRQAMDIAIDRASIAKNVELGLGTPARSMLSPAYWAYSNQVPAIAYDPAKAKQLLGGHHYTFQMQVPPTYTQQAQVIKSNLAAIGITVNIVNMDWSTLVDNYFKKNFQIQIEDQTSTWPDPNDQLAGFYSPNGAYNGTQTGDPAIEALLNKGQATNDQAARKHYYIKVQDLAQQQALYLPVFYAKNARAWVPSLHGVPETPDSIINLRSAWTSK